MIILTQSAWASRATIQFAGVATTYNERTLPNMSQYIACSVMIANTSPRPQYISSIVFQSFSAANGSRLVPLNSSGVGNSSLTLEEIYNTGGSILAPSCTTAAGAAAPQARCTSEPSNLNIPSDPKDAYATINPGGYFIATVQTQQITQIAFTIVPCSGSFTIEDTTLNQAGSAVASGAISFVGEQAIVGGQFMGAMYMSGSHVFPGAKNLATNAAFGSQALPTLRDTMQMNLYCANACEQLVTNLNPNQRSVYCSAACGGGAGEQIDSVLLAGNPQSDSNFSSTSVSEIWRNFSGMLEEMQFPADSPPGVTNNGPSMDSSRIGSRPFHHNRAGNNYMIRPTALVRHANPHYAGGHVVEYILGPFETICSGNAGYHLSGGQDFRHTDSVIDSDTVFRVANSAAAGRGPPERLYCSHGHNQDSPYGFVAHSTPFTIWGGITF